MFAQAYTMRIAVMQAEFMPFAARFSTKVVPTQRQGKFFARCPLSGDGRRLPLTRFWHGACKKRALGRAKSFLI
jgi:hypothetical protein